MAPLSDRLDKLLGVLSSGGSSNGPALAAELGVSLRTLRRDMARLAARGIPIEAERGRGGGVRLPVRFGLGRLQLDHREAVELLLALAIAERLHSPLLQSSARSLRQKIGLTFPPDERTRIGRLRRRILHARPASSTVTHSWSAPRPVVVAAVQDGFLGQRAIEVEYATQRENT